MTSHYAIEPLDISGFDEFILYLNDHLRDNGSVEAGYFQPLPRAGSAYPPERASVFLDGMAKNVASPGWRRAWVARSRDGRIAGHIDLRAHPEDFAQHRCLLGMGVDRRHRRAGMGAALLSHARQQARDGGMLEWIDLQVISANVAALGLYRRAGFITVGERPDMFRIDGESFGYTTMSMRLGGR